jgi:hypothetical protein
MPVVRVKGVQNAMQFPDDMEINDIRSFLQRRFANQAVAGNQPMDLAPLQGQARASEQSLAQKAGQGISDALVDSGIISDRFGAQQIGKNVTSIGEFLPGIGDATAGDEFGRALKQGNFGDAAMAGVGAIPLIGDMAIFAGVLAKTANLGELAKAQKLESGGAGRDEVWKETGWVNDQGDWKFEIDDSSADFDADSLQGLKDYGWRKQGWLQDHPELYGAYPESAKINTQGIGDRTTSGEYDADTNEIGLNVNLKTEVAKSTNLHELQHAIQSREGFSSGGSPSNELALEMQKAGADEIRDTLNKMDSGELPYEYDKYRKLLQEKTRILTTVPDPLDSYRKLAGEVEARNVETRMDLTAKQRRDNPPWKTLDVPEDELIYRNSGKDKATK